MLSFVNYTFFLTIMINMLNKLGLPTVKLKGRSVVSYEEGTKKVFIDSELLQGESDLVIYFEDIKFWCEPDSSILISPEEKKESSLQSVQKWKKTTLRLSGDKLRLYF